MCIVHIGTANTRTKTLNSWKLSKPFPMWVRLETGKAFFLPPPPHRDFLPKLGSPSRCNKHSEALGCGSVGTAPSDDTRLQLSFSHWLVTLVRFLDPNLMGHADIFTLESISEVTGHAYCGPSSGSGGFLHPRSTWWYGISKSVFSAPLSIPQKSVAAESPLTNSAVACARTVP